MRRCGIRYIDAAALFFYVGNLSSTLYISLEEVIQHLLFLGTYDSRDTALERFLRSLCLTSTCEAEVFTQHVDTWMYENSGRRKRYALVQACVIFGDGSGSRMNLLQTI